MRKPFITVITPTYNRTKYLSRCLNSVRSQTFNDFEHLLVDGFSNGATKKIIDKYQKENPIKVRIVRSKPKGVTDAFNVGVKNAFGKYVIIINSDDWLFDKNVLTKVANILEKNGHIDWLQTTSLYQVRKRVFAIPNKLLKSVYFQLLSFHCPVSQQATFMKRSLFEKYGFFDSSLVDDMDTEYFYRLVGKVDIYFSNLYAGVFRVHKEQYSQRNGFRLISFSVVKTLYRKYGNIPIVHGLLMWKKYKRSLKTI